MTNPTTPTEPGVYEPTPAEIRKVAKLIRGTWSKAVKQRRRTGKGSGPVETGMIDLAAHNRRVP
jgi:hypothetical protein